MALKFLCPNCHRQVVTDYLSRGEDFVCLHCDCHSLVPHDAVATTGQSSLHRTVAALPSTRKSHRRHADSELASPWIRLGARAIDSAGLVVAFLVIALIVFSEEGRTLDNSFAISAMIWFSALYIVLELYLLSVHGQTLGKQRLKIRIVGYPDGERTGFVRNALLREIVNGIFALIPIYGIIDALYIFSKDHRCLHDRLAGTKVVHVGWENRPADRRPRPPLPPTIPHNPSRQGPGPP